MFDTHAHVHDAAFDDDREAVLERARAAGVRRILTIGTDLATSRSARDAAVTYGLDYAIGIHPHEAKDAPPDLARAFDELAAEAAPAPLAVGEMGLDYYYDHSPRDVQRRVLAEQLAYARDRDLPAIFHQRDAFDDFIRVLRDTSPGAIRGVVHCFTGNAEQARLLVDEFGLLLGIGGVVTFKTAADVREAVRTVGLEHVILETDSPYLAPVPHRGKRNEPAFVAAVAAAIATLVQRTPNAVAETTSATAAKLFGR